MLIGWWRSHVSGLGYPEDYKGAFELDRRWQRLSRFAKWVATRNLDFCRREAPFFTRLRACGSLQRNALHIVIGLVTLTREA
jgi:hypothetical protein